MKRRCNICLVNKQHNVSKRHNPDVTICHECEMIIKRIVYDTGVII
jgi:transcription initiation factor TFIIIB Brf1 subunit/transcription initiation factor TFIIB